MDDKELVEVCRKEFIKLAAGDFNVDYSLVRGSFMSTLTECAYQGFLMAKRSQSSVVLPEPLICHNKNGQIDRVYTVEQLTAAGIKYTIGE